MTKIVLHIAEAAGGVERYLLTLLGKLKMYKELEHILVCSVTFDTQKFKGLVKSVIVVKEMRNAISLSDFKSVFVVRKIIKQYSPNVIYCHSSKAGAIGRLANIGIKNNLIYNAHGWSFNMKMLSWHKSVLYQLVERLLAMLTDKIVCISEYERISALEHNICKDDKLVVINNGIDFDENKRIIPKTRKDLGIPSDSFVVGTIGRLSVQKAPDVFINMAKLVKEQISNAFFVMVGDDISGGNFRENTEKQIHSLGLDDCVIITGWVDEPLDYIGLFDVGVLLSRWEGFGLVLLEYMYMGKPIVASNADAIPYVVGNAGILCDIDNYESAANSVIRLYEDEELRSRITREGNERVKLFDSCKTAEMTRMLLS